MTVYTLKESYGYVLSMGSCLYIKNVVPFHGHTMDIPAVWERPALSLKFTFRLPGCSLAGVIGNSDWLPAQFPYLKPNHRRDAQQYYPNHLQCQARIWFINAAVPRSLVMAYILKSSVSVHVCTWRGSHVAARTSQHCSQNAQCNLIISKCPVRAHRSATLTGHSPNPQRYRAFLATGPSAGWGSSMCSDSIGIWIRSALQFAPGKKCHEPSGKLMFC